MDLEYLRDKIFEELEDAKRYIIDALEIKPMTMAWAKTLVAMSAEELGHATNLFKMAQDYYKKIQENYKVVPEYLSDIYKELNDKYASCYPNVKLLHEAFNN